MSSPRLRTLPLYLAPAGVIYSVFVLWPLLQVVWLSLHSWDGYGPQSWVRLSNYAALWNDSVFRTSLSHTLFWDAGGIVLCTTAGFGLALLLERTGSAPLFLTALFLPVLLPPAVVAALSVLVYSPVHGLDALLQAIKLGTLARAWLGDPHLALAALFVAWLWSTVGIGALLFWNGLRSIGRQYYDLARVEGAGPLQRFRYVTVPALRRTAIVVMLVNAALASQVFDLVYVSTGGGPGFATMLIPLDAYGRAFGDRAQVGQAAAAACFQIALSLALGLVAFALLRHAGDSLDGEREALAPPQALFFFRALAAGTIGLFLLPLVWLPFAALQPAGAFAGGSSWSWDSFGTVWSSGMDGAIGNSSLLALGVTAATLVLAAPAAFALLVARNKLLTLGSVSLLVAGLLQPTPVLIIPLFAELHNLHLLDTAWGIALPEVARTLPLAILVLWGFMTGSGHDFLEAAAVDGASAWRQMRRIALPAARPALMVVAVWSFVLSWNEYLLPTVVSQDGSLQTAPTVLGSFIGTYDTQFNLLAAGTIVAMLPVLGIYAALQRTAATGLTRAGRSVR